MILEMRAVNHFTAGLRYKQILVRFASLSTFCYMEILLFQSRRYVPSMCKPLCKQHAFGHSGWLAIAVALIYRNLQCSEYKVKEAQEQVLFLDVLLEVRIYHQLPGE
jgi:hypothetical protein